MKLEETVNSGIGILSLSGNLVKEEATELRGLIKPYLEDEKYKGLIVNLDKVNHIDSAGVGAIVAIFKSLKRDGRTFALSGLNEKNRALFNISKIDRFLIITENDQSALHILDEMPTPKAPSENPKKPVAKKIVPQPPMTKN